MSRGYYIYYLILFLISLFGVEHCSNYSNRHVSVLLFKLFLIVCFRISFHILSLVYSLILFFVILIFLEQLLYNSFFTKQLSGGRPL